MWLQTGGSEVCALGSHRASGARGNAAQTINVEAILDGRQGPEVTLASLMKPFPVEWEKQRL